MPLPEVDAERRTGDVRAANRTSSVSDRVITVLVWWWAATPLVLLTPVIALAVGVPGVREEFGRTFALAALISAVVPPVVGFSLALAVRRQHARRRFVTMGVVSGVLVLLVWIFGGLLAECPDGYHC